MNTIPPSSDQWVITIRDLTLPCFIGVLPKERLERQPVCIALKCYAHLTRTSKGKLNYICYDELLTKIKLFTEAGHVDLVENLAEAICRICFEYAAVYRVYVHVEKTAVYSDGARVGVEIERFR